MNVRKLAWIENTRLEALEALTQEDSQALYASLQNALAKELDNGADEELLSKIESAMDDVEQSWLMPTACKSEEDNGTIDMQPQPEDIMSPNEAQLKSAQARLSNTQDRLDSGYYEERGLTTVATEAAEKLAAEIVEIEAACKNEEDNGTIIAPTKEQNMDNPSTENRTAEEALETLRIGDLTLNELLSTGLLSPEQFRKAIGWAEGEEETVPSQPSSSLPEGTLVGLSKAEQKAKVLEVIQSLSLETFKNGHILKHWFPNGKGQGAYEALRVKNHQLISGALKALVADGDLVKVSATNACHTGYQLAAAPQ